ncbi:MAG: FKBP-type peptidyl-prolyl cis-trans isomerase [Bacteroidia bacterium]|nr:FKBP-type peptidyl-prolyl cis-trans isomerase [Bacteroidia bacterium]
MMKNFPLLSLLVALSFSACQAPSPQSVEMNTQLDSIAYAVGMDIGKFYHTKQQIKLNPELIYAGIKDIVTQDSGKTRFSEDKGVALIDAFSRMMEAKRAATNEINEKAFLSENAIKPQVNVMAEGVQYQVLEEGIGASPRADNVVKVRIDGRLLDGTLFASSANNEDNTIEVDIALALPGLQLALTSMKPGDKWRVWIPSQLGYGSESRPPISPNSLLVYDIELLEILR